MKFITSLRIKKTLSLLFLFLTTISLNANAHVKWFVASEGVYSDTHFKFDYINLFLFTAFIAFMSICIALHLKSMRNIHYFNILHRPIFRIAKSSNLVFSFLKLAVGILLISNLLQNHFIAPNFVTESPTQNQILLQAGLLIVLIFNVDLFAISLFVLSILLFMLFPFQSAIDYSIELIAISIALYFTNEQRKNRKFQLSFGGITLQGLGDNIGLTALRIGLGAQLIILTAHDKFLHPGLALQFLDQHKNFNFVSLMGFTDFTNLHFVFAACLAELSFGLLLITNISSRVGLALILFFFSLTGVVLGLEELMGHIPIIIAALILFLFPVDEFIKVSRASTTAYNY